MSEPPPPDDPARGEAGDEDEGTPPDGTPLWVKVFAAVALLLLVLVVVLFASGRGGHGPGRHGEPRPPGPVIAGARS
jgi:hypothetical protein